MKYAEYFSDNPTLGSGWRLVLVYNEKRVKVTPGPRNEVDTEGPEEGRGGVQFRCQIYFRFD
jgi:hypothetical protein